MAQIIVIVIGDDACWRRTKDEAHAEIDRALDDGLMATAYTLDLPDEASDDDIDLVVTVEHSTM